MDQTSKTVLIFIENCGFYGIKSEARVQVMKTPMKRHRESRRFQAILAQNSDRAFDVIHHWIGRFVNFFFTDWKTNVSSFQWCDFWCLALNITVFLTSLKTAKFWQPHGFDTHSFWGVAVQNWSKENKWSSNSTCQIGQCLFRANIVKIACEM